MKHFTKLIEVALPLDAINVASAREKSIRHGHPSTLHLWWARRPLAAARAVIFAQMVDDPSAHPDLFPTEKAQEKERLRLFKIIEDLVKWENTTNEEVLQRARDEIWQSWRYACAANADDPRAKELFNRDVLPAFHDPFAGGGALPLEAQRLGLEAYASDLNPVAVLICKAMIEIPAKFADMSPVNPPSRSKTEIVGREWHGAQGIADDVRYYGRWMRNEAKRRIGQLYPTVAITKEMALGRSDLSKYVGRDLTVIAWIWARTVKSPNPAFAAVDVPLVASFLLGTKPAKEAYVEAVVGETEYWIEVRTGKPLDPAATRRGTKLSRGANFECVMSKMPITGDYIKSEGRAGRMGVRLMAVVAAGDRSRVYLSPTSEFEEVARSAHPGWEPDTPLGRDPRALWTPPYGITTFGDLFTPRQLVSLTTFADLIPEVREAVRRDRAAYEIDTNGPTDETHEGYEDAMAVYLAFAVDRAANYGSTGCTWHSGAKYETITSTFARQALPMTWDFAEGNPFSDASGNWVGSVDWIANAMEALPSTPHGHAVQANATQQSDLSMRLISTDPPYYDNIGYADLADFFYVWLRRALHRVYPDLFLTVTTPKDAELVANPYRQGGKGNAERFFLDEMTLALSNVCQASHPGFPATIYYAFKQKERDLDDGVASTGWDTFLDAVIQAGLAITGTWPVRTEYTGNLKKNVGALASSIVLVCRPRPADLPSVARREFVADLKAELPTALAHLQRGNIAPVDLAQAAIGPGMAVFTRYRRVLDAEGNPLSVRQALALINHTLDEALAEQEGDFDADTQWAVAWFEQSGFAEGAFGVAETLSRAKNTSVAGMVTAGMLASGRGKVRLLRPEELPADWDPTKDSRPTVWEIVHHLIRVLEFGGESAAASLIALLGTSAEVARELAYRLYVVCERKKRAAEALSYNGLVQSWPEINRLAREGAPAGAAPQLFGEDSG